MLPNIITLVRVALVFVTVGLYGRGFTAAACAVGLTVLVIWMDALDGWVARRTGQATDMGALFDITGDRIVENVFWIFFATGPGARIGTPGVDFDVVSFWVPIVVITRGFLTDIVRSLQFERGKTPFGEKTMMQSSWSRFLVAGRFMRGLYGGLKAVVFCFLGMLLLLEYGLAEGRFGLGPEPLRMLAATGKGLVGLTVALCVVRGAPVLWDGRDLLLRRMLPRPPD